MRRQTLGLLGFAGAAVGGAALGWLAERRLAPPVHLDGDPQWSELHRPVRGRPQTVTSFDGTRLYVETIGPPGAPAVVMVHGYGLGLRSWHYQRRDLSAAFRVIAYDQRGHARSEEPASRDYSIVALARDLEVVLDAATDPSERVVVVGHSLGGMTVLAWAGQYPQLVRRRLAGVVLMDTTGSDVLAGGFAATSIAALQTLQRRLVDSTVGVLGRRAATDGAARMPTDLTFLLGKACGFSAGASPAHVAFVEQMLLDCSTGVKAALGPTVTSLDLRAAAPLLTVPALVLVGKEDKLTPPSAARRLVASLPDARLVEIPAAGHNPMIEAHAAVTAQIREFVRRVPTRPATSSPA